MSERCNLDVGCDEYGVCYAEAHGQPEMCGRLAQVGTHPKGGDSLGAPALLSDAVAEGHAPTPYRQVSTDAVQS